MQFYKNVFCQNNEALLLITTLPCLKVFVSLITKNKSKSSSHTEKFATSRLKEMSSGRMRTGRQNRKVCSSPCCNSSSPGHWQTSKAVVCLQIDQYFCSQTFGFGKKFSQKFNLVKKLLWRGRWNHQVKFLTKISAIQQSILLLLLVVLLLLLLLLLLFCCCCRYFVPTWWSLWHVK